MLGTSRETIINHLIDKYGEDHVCYVGNRLLYSSKSAIRDLGQIYDIQSSETVECSKLFDDNKTVKENIKGNKKIKAFFDKYPELVDKIDQFNGINSALGVHAGGVVITDRKYPISKYVALQRPGDGGRIATLWTKKEVAQIGLIKYDLLGLDCPAQVYIGKQLLGKDPLVRFDLDNNIIKEESLLVKNRNVFQFETNIGKKALIDLKKVLRSKL